MKSREIKVTFQPSGRGVFVLAHEGKFQATSTAAGPAFEGARIVQGMRATTGAIEKVVLQDDVVLNVIGNAASLGAGLALLSADERERAERLRGATEHVDLSLDPEFQMEFGMAMMFPDGDVDACFEGAPHEESRHVEEPAK